MWRILVVLLIGLLPASAQLIGEGVFRKVPSGGACSPALAIDGAVNGNNTAAVVLSLTTTTTNDIIVVFVAQNGSVAPPTVADTASLMWSQRAVSGTLFYEFWAKSAGTLSSDSITVTNIAGGFVEATAFGIKGASSTTVYDTNGALPAINTGTPVTVSTSNANDILIAGSRNSGTAGPDTGFTTVVAGSFLTTQYKIVSATQSSLSIADPAAGVNGMIGDAIRCAP